MLSIFKFINIGLQNTGAFVGSTRRYLLEGWVAKSRLHGHSAQTQFWRSATPSYHILVAAHR